MNDALRSHWPEYLIEAALLGVFMVAACAAVVIFQHPASPVARVFRFPHRRRILIGILMGLTAIALIYSPWGQRSGAHLNPGITLMFLVLGKVQPWDAAFYVLAQFVGGFLGVRLAAAVLGMHVAHETVNYAATLPGRRGVRIAWLAEFIIAFGMMSMVLLSINHAATAPYTGVFAGLLVAAYIAIEAPVSGMSMNPARTLGSRVTPAHPSNGRHRRHRRAGSHQRSDREPPHPSGHRRHGRRGPPLRPRSRGLCLLRDRRVHQARRHPHRRRSSLRCRLIRRSTGPAIRRPLR